MLFFIVESSAMYRFILHLIQVFACSRDRSVKLYMESRKKVLKKSRDTVLKKYIHSLPKLPTKRFDPLSYLQ